MAKGKMTTSPAVAMTRKEAASAELNFPSVESPDCHFPREITDDKRLADAVAWVTWRDLQRKRVAEELAARIEQLKADAAEFLEMSGVNAPRYDEAAAAIEAYIRRHRKRLLADGKTFRAGIGTVKVRDCAPALCATHRHDDKSVAKLIDEETGAAAAVDAALAVVGARPWLRAKLELDKDGIKSAATRGEIGSSDLAARFLKIVQDEAIALSRAA